MLWKLLLKEWIVQNDWIISTATSWGARGILKLALIVGGGTTAVTSDRATQIAAAAVTVLVFVLEQVQSYIATRRALQTPPDPTKPLTPTG